MSLGLCCGLVVVSMETEHNFEHNVTLQWHNKRKKEHCWNSIIRNSEHNSEDPNHNNSTELLCGCTVTW